MKIRNENQRKLPWIKEKQGQKMMNWRDTNRQTQSKSDSVEELKKVFQKKPKNRKAEEHRWKMVVSNCLDNNETKYNNHKEKTKREKLFEKNQRILLTDTMNMNKKDTSNYFRKLNKQRRREEIQKVQQFEIVKIKSKKKLKMNCKDFHAEDTCDCEMDDKEEKKYIDALIEDFKKFFKKQKTPQSVIMEMKTLEQNENKYADIKGTLNMKANIQERRKQLNYLSFKRRERDRFSSPNCNCCNIQAVEDDDHIYFECSVNEFLRNKLDSIIKEIGDKLQVTIFPYHRMQQNNNLENVSDLGSTLRSDYIGIPFDGFQRIWIYQGGLPSSLKLDLFKIKVISENAKQRIEQKKEILKILSNLNNIFAIYAKLIYDNRCRVSDKIWKMKKRDMKLMKMKQDRNLRNANLDVNGNTQMSNMSLAFQDPSGPFGDG